MCVIHNIIVLKIFEHHLLCMKNYYIRKYTYTYMCILINININIYFVLIIFLSIFFVLNNIQVYLTYYRINININNKINDTINIIKNKKKDI